MLNPVLSAQSGLQMLFIADALSMAVHWYYDPNDISSQFPGAAGPPPGQPYQPSGVASYPPPGQGYPAPGAAPHPQDGQVVPSSVGQYVPPGQGYPAAQAPAQPQSGLPQQPWEKDGQGGGQGDPGGQGQPG